MKPAGSKYTPEEMDRMYEKRISKMKFCPTHTRSQEPCRVCNNTMVGKIDKKETI